MSIDYLLDNESYFIKRQEGISPEDLELLQKIKKLPSDKRDIVEAVIKVSEAADEHKADAAAKQARKKARVRDLQPRSFSFRVGSRR